MNFEAMLVAGVMGLKCMFTDHSLFNFIAFENHILNKMIKTLFCHLDATIWVSHVNKENFTLRMRQDPRKVYVINNAVNTRNFRPLEENEILDPVPGLQGKVLKTLVNTLIFWIKKKKE